MRWSQRPSTPHAGSSRFRGRRARGGNARNRSPLSLPPDDHVTTASAFVTVLLSVHQCKELRHCRHVARRPIFAEHVIDGSPERAIRDSASAPEVGNAPSESKGLRRPSFLEQRLQPALSFGIPEHRDQEPGRIAGDPGERILSNRRRDLLSRQHGHSGDDAKLRGYGSLKRRRETSTSPWRRKHGVPAVEQRAHAAAPKAFEERPEIRHCDALRAPDVDSAKERYLPLGHLLTPSVRRWRPGARTTSLPR